VLNLLSADNITDLQPFFTGSIAHIRNPLVRRWAAQLAQERQQLWAERGMGYVQPEVRDQGGA
jgi:putative hydrolase of HD superfamily